jgi:hypothetical protein
MALQSRGRLSARASTVEKGKTNKVLALSNNAVAKAHCRAADK